MSLAYRQPAAVEHSATPLRTGTRPWLVLIASSITRRFSSGSNAVFSPSEPSITKPVTPDFRGAVLKDIKLMPEWRVEKVVVGLERMTDDPRPGGRMPITPTLR